MLEFERNWQVVRDEVVRRGEKNIRELSEVVLNLIHDMPNNWYHFQKGDLGYVGNYR